MTRAIIRSTVLVSLILSLAEYAGNPVSNSAVGSYTYPAAGPGAVRLRAPTAVGARSFSYDANGNMVSDGVRTLGYDGANRLVSVTTPTGSTSYAYGPDGDRVVSTSQSGIDPAVTRHMLGDGMEIDEAGVLTKIPNADIRKVGSTTCLVHRDHLSAVKLETDAAGGAGPRQRFAPIWRAHTNIRFYLWL